MANIGRAWRRGIRTESSRPRVLDDRTRHSLFHPLQVREDILRGRGVDIHLIVLGGNSLDLPRRGLWLGLVCPGRTLPSPWLHHLLELFEVFVGWDRSAIDSVVGLQFFALFADGRGEIGDVRWRGIGFKLSAFRWSLFFIPNSLTTMS